MRLGHRLRGPRESYSEVILTLVEMACRPRTKPNAVLSYINVRFARSAMIALFRAETHLIASA
jgi:hypothetical protein